MIRTTLLAATLAAFGLSASTAEACVSCSYTPEVIGNNSAPSAKPQKRERVNQAVKERKARKERTVQKKSLPKKAIAERSREKALPEAEKAAVSAAVPETPAAAPVPAIVEPVVAAPVTPPEPVSLPTETATIPPAPIATEAAPKTVTTADSAAVNVQAREETSSVAAASSEVPAKAEPASNKSGGCKKFFPMADLTLTVACK